MTQVVGIDKAKELMKKVYSHKIDSLIRELSQERLRVSFRERRKYTNLIDYVKENREGILAFQKLKKAFPEIAESLFVICSGGVEKNIEIFIGRRFKKIGAHWSKKGAGRLIDA
jgi:hypothetical protein